MLLLVHGAWHGSWAWDPVLPLLRDAGVAVRAVDLAVVGRAPGRHDLAGHVDALRAEIAAVDGPLVVVGHSYGGAVVTAAAAGAANVAHLVYVSAFQLVEGESCVDANPTAPPAPPGLEPELDGDYLTVSPAAATYMFYTGCPAVVAERAAARVTPEHVATVGSPVDRAAWRDIPSTYVVCARDRALAPEAQHRMAARADERHVLDVGHSPMLSAPATMAGLLVDTVRGARLGAARP